MKDRYESVEVEVIRFEGVDIITDSDPVLPKIPDGDD